MINKIMNFVIDAADLGTRDTIMNDEFDNFKYDTPVENARINKVIEAIQFALIMIPFTMFGAMIFFDFTGVEVTLSILLPVLVIFILEQFKDKEAQKAYDEFSEWELEQWELQEDEDY